MLVPVVLALAALLLLVGLFVGPRAKPRDAALDGPDHAELPAPEQLAGGDPSRAIMVDSPAVIERHAERWPCPVCESSVRCEQHRAELIAGQRLRVARVRCPRCGFERDVYFVLRGS
jgi:ribosomal protein S27AE